MVDRSWYEGVFRAVDSGDAAGFCRYLTPDTTFRWGAQEVVHGNEAVEGYVNEFLGMFDGTRHEVFEAIEAGDVRVVRGEVTYFMKDGREIATPFCNVFHMEGTKIRDYLIYIDPSPLNA